MAVITIAYLLQKWIRFHVMWLDHIMFTCSPLAIHSLEFILATIVWQTRMFLLGCLDSLSSKLIEDFLESLTRAIG